MYLAVRRFLEAALVALLVLLVGIVLANVVGRYALGAGIVGADEVARFLFIWLTFIGAVVALDRGAHLGMDIATTLVPPATGRALELLALVLMLAFIGIWATAGFEFARRSMGLSAPATGVSRGLVYAIAPVAAGLMGAIVLKQIAARLRNRKN